VATSAPVKNVDFVLDSLKIREYVDVVVDDSMVRKGKPDPEIYIKAASLLQVIPGNCIVFEDSLSGTRAAFDAGTTVVAITTTMPAEEHRYAHQVISDFKKVTLQYIK